MFGISANTISCVFKTWLIFMFKKFGHDEWRKRLFVRRQDLPQPLPEAFCNKMLEKVRVVIDCTEIEIQKPRNYQKQ